MVVTINENSTPDLALPFDPNCAFINGKFVPVKSGETRDLINPATGKICASVAEGGAADVNAAIDAARTAFFDGPWGTTLNAADRRDALLDLASAILDHDEPLALIESVNAGKPIAQARAEVRGCADTLRFFAGAAQGHMHGRHLSQADIRNFEVKTAREPKGVCGLITAFNFPIMLACWKIGPALACGNTVVLKPAPQTPLTSLYLAHLVATRTKIPAGVFNVVAGGLEAGKALTGSRNVDMISFTGSPGGGAAVMAASATLANGLKPVTLELGGKSPVVVMDDADLDRAVGCIAAGIFTNAGQICCAASKIYVHEKVADQVVARLQAAAEGWRVGLGAKLASYEERAHMGPVVDEAQFNRVMSILDAAKAEGAGKLVTGGNRIAGSDGFYVEPTVYCNMPHGSKLANTEVFGPVVTVMTPFKNLDEVLLAERETEYGLTAAIFTTNGSTAAKYSRGIRAGTVWVNTYNNFFPQVPFSGVKQSGIGVDLGLESMYEFTAAKSIVARLD